MSAENFYLDDKLLTPNSPAGDILFLQVEEDLFILHPDVQNLLAKAERRCDEADICAHDLPHIIRTLSNAFVLHEMLQASSLSAPVATDIPQADISCVMPFHDLGYGADTVEVNAQKRQVEEHEQASWQFLLQRMHAFPRGHRSRRYFAQQHDMLFAGILGTEKDHSLLIQDALEYPNPQTLFALIVAAADKADYFIKQRVSHLESPKNMANPYHTLAHAVASYHLEVNHYTQTLTYHAKLHHNTGLKIDDPVRWQLQVEKDYPQVFALLTASAHIAGYTFEVRVE